MIHDSHSNIPRCFEPTVCSLSGFCLSFTRWRTWRFPREADGDPPVLQPLPNDVQTYKYVQVDDTPVQITPTFSSPLNIPLNIQHLTLHYYLPITSFSQTLVRVGYNCFLPISRSLSLLENALWRMTYRRSNKISNPFPKIDIYFQKIKHY